MKTELEVKDIIDENLTKTKAILDCLLASWDSEVTIDRNTIYNTIWSACDYLQEIIDRKGV